MERHEITDSKVGKMDTGSVVHPICETDRQHCLAHQTRKPVRTAVGSGGVRYLLNLTYEVCSGRKGRKYVVASVLPARTTGLPGAIPPQLQINFGPLPEVEIPLKKELARPRYWLLQIW